MSVEKTDVPCPVCGALIVKEISEVFNPMSGPPIIGPGSKRQYMTTHKHYCDSCGVSFHHLPKQTEAGA